TATVSDTRANTPAKKLRKYCTFATATAPCGVAAPTSTSTAPAMTRRSAQVGTMGSSLLRIRTALTPVLGGARLRGGALCRAAARRGGGRRRRRRFGVGDGVRAEVGDQPAGQHLQGAALGETEQRVGPLPERPPADLRAVERDGPAAAAQSEPDLGARRGGPAAGPVGAGPAERRPLADDGAVADRGDVAEAVVG